MREFGISLSNLAYLLNQIVKITEINSRFFYFNLGYLSVMSQELKKILNSFDKILSENKSFVKEVSASSTELLGGKNVKIPRAGAHAGQAGWQSSNAWDIMAPIGTPVYAIADGVAQTFSDYGRSIIKTQGKKLYGQSFTVKSDRGLPDVYYTHLEGSPIKQGSKIQCGQFLGYIMDMPNSSADHVHIGISRGDISQFLDSNGKLKCGGGGITGDVGNYQPQKDTETSTETGTETNTVTTPQSSPKEKSFYKDSGLIKSIVSPYVKAFKESIQEQRIYGKLGNDLKVDFDSIIIPKDTNKQLKSPVNGFVKKFKFNPNCSSQLTIEHEVCGDKYYLEYCGLKTVKPGKNAKVNRGDVLGEVDGDIKITLYSSDGTKQNLRDFLKKEGCKSTTQYGKTQKEKQVYNGGLLSSIVKAALNPASTIDKILNPFGQNKLKEDIERIKGLIK